MASLSQVHTDLIKYVAKQNNFNDFDIQTTGGTQKGDGYMGTVQFITITEKDGNKKLDFALKCGHTSPEIRKQMPLREAYLREISMYKSIFPEFISFQKVARVEGAFYGIPKIYGYVETAPNESLLLENLSTSGYKLWDRKLPMNAEHVELVMIEYAKFHAVSFAFKAIYPEKFADLTKNLMTDVLKDSSIYEEASLKKMAKIHIKRGNSVLGNHPAKNRFGNYEKGIVDLIKEILKNPENLIVLHADAWCNNMMFKYEDNTNPQQPTKLCLLDFQACKIGTPVLDLINFLYVGTSNSVLQHLDEYLLVYHETLSKSIRQYGRDPEKLFPMEMLKSHWKKYSNYGLMCSFAFWPAMMSDVEDLPNISETAENGNNAMDIFFSDFINDSAVDEYNKRLYDLLTFLDKNELL